MKTKKKLAKIYVAYPRSISLHHSPTNSSIIVSKVFPHCDTIIKSELVPPIRTNPETIYMTMRSSPQITDQEATYAAYFERMDKNKRWRRYSYTAIWLGPFFIFVFVYLYAPKNLSEAEMQEYWRNIGKNGLINTMGFFQRN